MHGVQMVPHVLGAHSSLLLGSASDLVANFVDLVMPRVLPCIFSSKFEAL